MNDKIDPRTQRERRAYLDGYASAINDVSERGIDDAVRWLRMMIECELEDGVIER